MKKSITIVLLVLLLASCDQMIPRKPEVWIVPSGLEEHEMRPTFAWRLDEVAPAGFRVRLRASGYDSGWIGLGGDAESWRPEEFLESGTYTFEVCEGSTFGIWSDPATIGATVVAVAAYVPNDQYFAKPAIYDPYFDRPYQWNLDLIHVPHLWGILRNVAGIAPSREHITVAVVDTGYTEHPDITEHMDISSGYDFIADDEYAYFSRDGDGIDPVARDEGDGTPGGSPYYDNSWHGTGVASIIAASVGNNDGIAGIAVSDDPAQTYVTHIPVRVLGYLGGTTWDIGQGIAYAAGLGTYLTDFTGSLPAQPAKIVNLSLGASRGARPLYSDPAVDPILEAAAAAGVVMVAAAGNEREGGAYETTYPANSPYVISVGSVTKNEVISSFSNPGTFNGEVPTIDIAAPGGGPPYVLPPDYDTGYLSWYEYILTASPDPDANQPLSADEYSYYGTAGTSVAAPHVSGVLALLATIDSDLLDLNTARYVLKTSAKDLGEEGWDPDFGYGLIDAVDALSVFLRLVDGSETVPAARVARPYSTRANPMTLPDVEPDGVVVEGTLIIEFAGPGEAAAAESMEIPGVAALRPGQGGAFRLAYLEANISPESLRNELLLREDIVAVYYNYRYDVQ